MRILMIPLSINEKDENFKNFLIANFNLNKK